MTDPFLDRIEAMEKARKLLALASGNQNPNEANVAMAMAQRLAEKHQFSLTTMRPDAPLSESDKLAKMRNMFGTVGAKIKDFAPGQDTEDYTKYAKDRKDDGDR